MIIHFHALLQFLHVSADQKNPKLKGQFTRNFSYRWNLTNINGSDLCLDIPAVRSSCHGSCWLD